jgi:hypothetical protein
MANVIIHIQVDDRALGDRLIAQDIPNLKWLCTFIDYTVEPPLYKNTQFASDDISAIYAALSIIEEW